MKDSRIIDSPSLTSLMVELNKALREGWEIQGGLAYGMVWRDQKTWAVLLTKDLDNEN